mmetsp:Transcript_10822/g.37916  ORF Transcript_10822/g.37916 Transcript_10822/m.37916 type:complete len:697 (+) Transcript_10822:216-2306(+)
MRPPAEVLRDAKSPDGGAGDEGGESMGDIKSHISAVKSSATDIIFQSGVYFEHKAPWLDLDGRVLWSQPRIRLFQLVATQHFEKFMGCVIVFNMFLIMWETDYRAKCYPTYTDNLADCPYNPDDLEWDTILNGLLLAVYTLEAITHLYVHRMRYFGSRWNVIDFSVVMASYIALLAGSAVNISFLRIFRMVRLTRAFRVVLSIRELYMLLTGLASSFKAIFFGTMLLLMMLLLWSIVLVEMVHPVNALIEYDGCERCARGFSSIADSTLTLFQTIVASDSWGEIHVQVIESKPILAVILVAVFLSVSLGVMNLILAVIVESASEARDNDSEEKAKNKKKEQATVKSELLTLCEHMDTDLSGTITLDEMKLAFQTSEPFRRLMLLLEIDEKELDGVFAILDSDDGGQVDYTEFVDQMYDLRTGDVRMMVCITRKKLENFERLIKASMQDNRESIEENQKLLQSNNKFLHSLDEKISYLVGRSGGVVDAPPSDTKPSKQDYFDAASPDTSNQDLRRSADISSELETLQARLEELSGLSSDIVRKADEHVGILKKHTSLLKSVRRALPQDSGDSRQLPGVSQHVDLFRIYVREQLSGVLQDLELRLDRHSAVLNSGGRLLEGLADGLGLPISAASEAKAPGPDPWRMPQPCNHGGREDGSGSHSGLQSGKKTRERSGIPQPLCGTLGKEVDSCSIWSRR